MKKFTVLLCAILLSVLGYSQGHETFDNLELSDSSYQDGSFTGQDGSEWSFLQSRGDSEITGKALMLGRNRTPDAELESGTISGGIGTLKFSYMQAFTNDVNMDVFINGDLVYTATTNNEVDVIKTTEDIEVNVEGDFTIKFYNPNGAQVTIDDIIWTAYEGQGGETGEYCIPEGTNSDRYIDNFSTTGGVENISNMGTGFSTAGYGDFYDTHAVEQVQGESVDFSATIAGGYAHFKVWVDWNQDGEFDDTEEVVAYITTGSDIQNGSFEVPADAALGETRMRIASDWGYLYSIDPCATGWEYGEFEDYKFIVTEDDDNGDEPIDYCEPEVDCEDGDMITNVTFQEIDNDSACSPNGYNDFTDLVANVEAGETYPISVTVGDGWIYESVFVWVDFDNSGTFDEDEFFYLGTGSDETLTGNINIPAGLADGDYRMRVRLIAADLDDSNWDLSCTTAYLYGEVEDYTVHVGEATDPEPEDGCLWTVVVESGFYGDEVEWELRAADGEILLNGGIYEEYEYYDEQSVNAEGPVEFFISAGGALWDNIPVYSVSNENGVLVSGILHEVGERTYSDLNCDDMPEPEPSYICEDNMVSYSDDGVESAIDFGVSQLAIDMKAGDYSFPVYGIEVTFLADNPNTVTFEGILYNDEDGLPGAEISQPNLTMVNAEVIDSAYGFDVYVFRLAFDQPIEIEANSTNWLQINSNAEAWVNSWDVFGNGFVYRNQYTNDEWVKEYDDLVYTLICEELGVADLSSFDFAYYPNPVKDVLNITSQKGVESVSAFNLTGQKVMNNARVINGQIDVSNLAVGTYVFKVTLEDGSVETFKIIKR